MTLRDEIAAIGVALVRPIEVVELTEEEAVESFAAQAPRPLTDGCSRLAQNPCVKAA